MDFSDNLLAKSVEDYLLVERLTKEFIHKALDLCDELPNETEPSTAVQDFHAAGNGDKAFVDLSDNVKFEPEIYPRNPLLRSNLSQVDLRSLVNGHSGDDSGLLWCQKPVRRSRSAALLTQNKDVEVEYLERSDPFRGNVDVVADVDELLATSANKFPAEHTSFLQAIDKMSNHMSGAAEVLSAGRNVDAARESDSLPTVPLSVDLLQMDNRGGTEPSFASGDDAKTSETAESKNFNSGISELSTEGDNNRTACEPDVTGNGSVDDFSFLSGDDLEARISCGVVVNDGLTKPDGGTTHVRHSSGHDASESHARKIITLSPKLAARIRRGSSFCLNDTVSDVSDVLDASFLSSDAEGGELPSFSTAERMAKEILNTSLCSSTSSGRGRFFYNIPAAINTDSRMYNTLTFLDNDDSDDGEGVTGRDKVPGGAGNDATGNGPSQQLDNKKRPASDINDNPHVAEDDQVQETGSSADSKKKIVPNLELLNCDDLDLTFSPRASLPDLQLGDYYTEDAPDDFDTPDDMDSPVFGAMEDWTDDLNDGPVEPIPEYTAREEYEDVRNWRPVQIGGISYRIDMRAIEPYKKVLSHGGYYGNGLNAIVVFAACYLPERSRLDYRYIMDNLFLYVVSVLELLVVEDYMIIYFHAATSRNKVPALRWLKRCYDMIDHRLRKNLQRLLVVHPTFFLKTVILMTKPFISTKFSSKLHYVRSLNELTRLVPTEYIHLPDEVKQVDRLFNRNIPVPHKKFVNL